MSELEQKVQKSIERLQNFRPRDGSPMYLAFSGGKDSCVCKALLDMAKVPYDAVYRVTSVDPPELVRFIKNKHPDVVREVPRYAENYKNEKLAGKPITMWNLVPEKLMPPTRVVRYCCESGGDGRMTVTGVRWAESVNRAKNQGPVTIASKRAGKELVEHRDFSITRQGGVVLTNDNEDSRRVVEQCYKRHKTTVNPIIEWSDKDVWDFIHAHEIPYCELYDEGFHRLGCIGCPLSRQKGREKEFLRWPKYKHHYLLAFERMLEERNKRGLMDKSHWENGMDVFNWWLEYDVIPGQINLFDSETEYDEDE